MTIRISRDMVGVNWTEAAEVFRRSLGARDVEKLRRAFARSVATVAAYDSDRLIGMGRALSDGEYQAAIYDVVLLPEYQRRGIGRLLMKDLLDQLAVENIILYAVPGREGFYEKCGFRKMRTGMAILHPWMADAGRGYLDPPEIGKKQ